MTQAIINITFEKEYNRFSSLDPDWKIMDDFIFSEYKVKIHDEPDQYGPVWTILKVKRYPDHHSVEVFAKHNYLFTMIIPHDDFGIFRYKITAKASRDWIDKAKDDIEFLAQIYSIFIINFEMHVMTKAKERKITTVSADEVKKHSGKQKESLSTHRSETLNLSLEDTIRYVAEYSTTRQYTKHVESFNVRGHYRHYKNGKVVFVKAFVKGDKNKTPKTRTYEM